jgi:hypothetical protein
LTIKEKFKVDQIFSHHHQVWTQGYLKEDLTLETNKICPTIKFHLTVLFRICKTKQPCYPPMQLVMIKIRNWCLKLFQLFTQLTREEFKECNNHSSSTWWICSNNTKVKIHKYTITSSTMECFQAKLIKEQEFKHHIQELIKW